MGPAPGRRLPDPRSVVRFAGCGTCAPTATTVSEAAVPESHRTPSAGTAASGFTPLHELHRALANVTRTGDEQLRGEAAQIVAEATSRLNGLLAADR